MKKYVVIRYDDRRGYVVVGQYNTLEAVAIEWPDIFRKDPPPNLHLLEKWSWS